MNIYIATKFENSARAQFVAEELKSHGHLTTYAWWDCEQVSTKQAEADRLGVMNADALVLILEADLKYQGAWVEFGIACARRIPVYVLGEFGEKCIFLQLPFVQRVGLTMLLHILDAQEKSKCHT